MKIKVFSIFERFFNFFLFLSIFIVTTVTIICFIYYKDKINPFYLNLILVVMFFIISLQIAEWKRHIDKKYPQRIIVYNNMRNLLFFHRMLIDGARRKRMDAAIPLFYNTTGRKFSDVDNITLNKNGEVLVKTENIVFIKKVEVYERKYCKMYREFRSRLEEKVLKIYDESKEFEDNKRKLCFLFDIEDIEKKIMDEYIQMFTENNDTIGKDKFIKKIKSLINESKKEINKINNLERRLNRYYKKDNKKIRNTIRILENKYGERIFSEPEDKKKMNELLKEIDENINYILEEVDKTYYENDLQNIENDINNLSNGIEQVKEIIVDIKEEQYDMREEILEIKEEIIAQNDYTE